MDKTFFKTEFQRKLAKKFEDETGESATRTITDGVHRHTGITVWHYKFVDWLMYKADDNGAAYSRLEKDLNNNEELEASLIKVNSLNRQLVSKMNDFEVEKALLNNKHRRIKKEIRFLNKKSNTCVSLIKILRDDSSSLKITIEQYKRDLKEEKRTSKALFERAKKFEKIADNNFHNFIHRIIQIISFK